MGCITEAAKQRKVADDGIVGQHDASPS
jgi:hypothetical protein